MSSLRTALLSLVVLALVALAWWAFGAGAGEVVPAGAAPGAGSDQASGLRIADGIGRDAQESMDSAPDRRSAIEEIVRGHGALLVRVVAADGETALPHVAVRLMARDGRPNDSTRTIGVTDERGSVRFAQLDAGPWAISTDRAIANSTPTGVEVRVGEEVEVTIRATEGVDATVRVLDAQGGRVPGAEVMLWPASGHLDSPTDDPGSVVGITDADGELLLRALPFLGFGSHSSWVAARHPLLGASAARMVRAPKDEGDHAMRIVELTVPLAGASITIRVVGTDGRSLRDARVSARPIDEPGSKDDAQGRVLSHLLREQHTDERGLAVLEPLAAGDYLLRVRAAGHVPFRDTLRVTGQERVVRDVELAPAARVHGVVTSRDGTPIFGATVIVQQEPSGGTVTTAADGTFRLDQLAPGTATWIARHDAFRAGEGGFELATGIETELSIVLDPLARLRLRLVDDLERGVAGLSVMASAELPGRTDQRRGTSAADGQVELPARADLEYTLEVFEPELFIPLPIPDPGLLRARDDAWIVRVPDAARASAFVEGTLVDVGDHPAIDGCFIAVEGHGRMAYPGSTMAAAETDAATGRFRLGPLPPGEYVLRITDRARFEFAVEGVVLRPHGTTDLGIVRQPAAGNFEVELKADPAVLLTDLRVQLDGTGASEILAVDGATLRAARAMLPGRYKVTVYGSNFRWLNGTIDVAAGETVTFRGTLVPAVRVGLRFHMPAGETGTTFEVHDARGEFVFDAELEKGVASEDWWPFFDRGTFFVTAVGASGKRYATQFTIDSLARNETPIDVRVAPVR